MRGTLSPKMNEALRERYTAIGELLVNDNHDTALRWYKVGAVVAEIMADEKKYGQGAVLTLATALGNKPTRFYEAAKVARTWTLTEFNKVLRRPTCHRVPLSFSHFVLLSLAGKRRDALIERALAEGLSIVELRKLIMSKKKKRKQSPEKTVKRATKIADKFGEVLDELDPIAALAEEHAPEFWAKLKLLTTRLVEMVEIGRASCRERVCPYV